MISLVIPKLPFIEKEKTLDYYQKLGFKLVADHGDYLITKYQDLEIHFFRFETLQTEKSDFMIYLRIDNDIEKFYQDIQNQGVEIHPNGKLETKPWGMIEFALIDPNGTLLSFGQEN
ncbi:VOC family protein [Epilithonimonas sp. JDS]|uniref:bleomycin resistance protein n=1 Tax=Epilithonimonas sp. JDS TaxID=2902797 RepID=UPI001E619990|nr:VOC family protein [Epilithonimonas sp. JDS]MCD9855681.1 VOC family protein [Epilithonimonas sp. JDS]